MLNTKIKEILQNMLNGVTDRFDKREGSFIYDALAPVAEQLSSIEDEIGSVKDKFRTTNLTGQELTQRVKDITGIDRKAATKATGAVTLIGTGSISIGDLFETSDGTQFIATEYKNIVSTGTVIMEAVVAGAGGNVPAETISLFPITIPGFTAVINPNPTTGGFDEESDVDLIQRYYERLQTPATSGNKAQYKIWAKEVQGVGDAKVFPLWDGANTVKVVIIDSNREPAEAELVEEIQNYIDPGIEGLGEGVAPLGAYCTVVSAIGKVVDIEVEIIVEPGYTVEEVQPLIEAGLTNFLRSIAIKADIVSYALIGANIINTQGVMDYNSLLVNGASSNILLDAEETPVLGTVTITNE